MEAPVGTADFTSYLLKIDEKKPDIVMMAQWGTDAIGVLKQAYETGLKKKTKIWFNWMTNVFGSGVPADAIEGVYSLMSWYYDMTGFADPAIVNAAKAFTEKFTKEYKYPRTPIPRPPIWPSKRRQGPLKTASPSIQGHIQGDLGEPQFDSMRGPGTWRIDHQPSLSTELSSSQGKGTRIGRTKMGSR